ncbi:MAG: potassium channel family protein [Dehalococcoidia bacterium]
MRSEARLQAVERATDLPLTLLAVILIPLLVLPLLFDLPAPVVRSFEAGDYLIWGVFAAVFTVKLAVAPRRIPFLRENWLEAALVVLPMLRPLRAMRALRLARVVAAVGFNIEVSERFFAQRSTRVVAALTVALLAGGAGLVLAVERDADGANITNFGDALWWAAVTITTIGYGDHFPVTAAGRGVALALTLVGIAVVSTLTAAIAALIVREGEGTAVELSDIMRELKEIRGELEALRAMREENGAETRERPPG